MEVLVGVDRDASAAAMREHVITQHAASAWSVWNPISERARRKARLIRASSSPSSFRRYGLHRSLPRQTSFLTIREP